MMQRFITERSKKQLTTDSTLVKKVPVSAYTPLLLLLILLTIAFVSSLWSTLSTTNTKPTIIGKKTSVANVVSAKDRKSEEKSSSRKRFELEATLNCSNNGKQRCSSYPTSGLFEREEGGVCLEYFRWIQEDVGAWKERGISREMVERAKKSAHFRLVVKRGRVYVERDKKSIQTREAFMMWGIMQLLRK
ncbi:hypothetical protein AAZV13_05G077080 [Glycine max]|uniref:uncharacterized protein LOC114411212 n=1 Tax=Glycine soja TaxID=3848 RepID=UPI00103D6E0C|nr:uncharacterized protein LOC114411212 [Glycine soja]KAH1249857.1 hypothetical protein GmHk_05G013131 [Glycine max]